MKTKWKPFYFYRPVAENSRKMIFIRYDNKTGLFDFQTKEVCKGMYSCDEFKININPQEVFESFLKEQE